MPQTDEAMTLHADIRGPVGERVVLLHGFTQNARCWGPFGELMSTKYESVFVDLPGHGRSKHDDVNLPRTAELVAAVGGDATYVGYSMGGRVALHVALSYPHLVKRLVLIGATAGIPNDVERKDRFESDVAQAQQLEANGLEAFLMQWLAGPLFHSLSRAAAHLPERLTNRAEGVAASLRNAGTGTQENLWPRLPEVFCPTLLFAGANDTKFTEIGRTMAAAIGDQAICSIVPGGHSVHLESPEHTWSLFDTWMSETSV